MSRAERAAIMSIDMLLITFGGVTNRCTQGLMDLRG
jgi:hypothetical protein